MMTTKYEKAKASRRTVVCTRCESEYIYPFGSTKDLCPNCYLGDKRELLKKRALEYLGGRCIECGYGRCVQALHFHHLRDKEWKIADMIARGHAWKRIQTELDKCVLLCANCHAEHHAGFVEDR